VKYYLKNRSYHTGKWEQCKVSYKLIISVNLRSRNWYEWHQLYIWSDGLLVNESYQWVEAQWRSSGKWGNGNRLREGLEGCKTMDYCPFACWDGKRHAAADSSEYATPSGLTVLFMLLYTIYDLVSSLRYMIFIFLRHFVISLITVLVIIIIICDWTVRPKPVAHGVVAYREPLQKWNYHIIWVH